jgi:hypothetical protein
MGEYLASISLFFPCPHADESTANQNSPEGTEWALADILNLPQQLTRSKSSISGLPTLALKVAALIGYKPATDAMAGHYSAFDTETLYDEYDGTINVENIFCHSLLLKVCLVFFSISSLTFS